MRGKTHPAQVQADLEIQGRRTMAAQGAGQADSSPSVECGAAGDFARRSPLPTRKAEIKGYLVVLISRLDGDSGGQKRYLCREAGRTLLLADRSRAAVYPTYRTAHMIGTKAAIHYHCLASVEEA